MRVALVATETVHQRDTQGNRRFQRLAEQLTAAGHDVTVYCTRWWEGNRDVFEPGDVRYRAVADEHSTAAFCLRLPAVLARDRPDVVHARPTAPGAVLAADVAGTLARAPLAVEWFGDESVPDTRVGGLAARRPDWVLTPSELVRTRVRERGASEARTAVVPESIEMDLVRETDPEEGVDVAFAHPLDGSSNLQSLFLGLAELRERDWSATVIGDGPHREEHERAAADLRIDDRVEFVGDCERERRVAIYRGAHVFVQTAFRELFATELLWALACGCVGVVEYQAESSAHELIEHRERSFRVTSTQQMAEAVVDAGEFEHLTVDEDLAEFDHEAVRRRYEDCYEELVEEHGWF